MLQHRVYVRPGGRWTLALWEGSVWSGVGRQAEPWYLNIVNLGLHVTGYGGNVNSFEGLDVERRGKVTVFGQVMLHDIPIERKVASDRKPTSNRFTVGGKGRVTARL